MTEACSENLIDYNIYKYLLACFQFWSDLCHVKFQISQLERVRDQILEEDFGLTKKEVTEDAEKLL